jgi:hypothetical protein
MLYQEKHGNPELGTRIVGNQCGWTDPLESSRRILISAEFRTYVGGGAVKVSIRRLPIEMRLPINCAESLPFDESRLLISSNATRYSYRNLEV